MKLQEPDTYLQQEGWWIEFGYSLFHLAQFFLVDVETVLVRWKTSLQHLLSVCLKSFQHHFAQIDISLGKFWSETIKET
jgi:hypothetical protein